MQELICEIKDLKDRVDLFKFKSRKDNVEHYKPIKDITIQSINIDNGYCSWNRITDYSVHYNLEMYSIFDPLNRFEQFYVSSDHSLIAWDDKEECIRKVTPLEAKSNEFLMAIIYHEEEDDYILIPFTELLIELDKTKTTGYDFTVENDFTFSTFDGFFVQDTAAIYMPLSMESQQDCKKMYIPTGMNNSTQLSLEIKHELVLSAYIITDNRKPMKPDYGIVTYKQLREDNMIGIKDNVHCHQTCTLKLPNGKSIKTTLGRALFNSLLPDEFLKKRYNWFLDKQINKKILNSDIIYNLSLEYTMETMADIVDNITNFLRVYTSVYPASLLLDEFMENTVFKALKEKYEKAKTMDEKQAIIGEIESKFKTGISDVMPMIDYIVASGSRGDPSQLRQMLVTKGLIQDAQGNLISINDCYVDGMKPEGAFMDGYGSRKGIMDRSRSTSVTGYLTRKIVYACASVLLDPDLNDCGTKRTIPVKITKDNAMLLYGRYMIDSKGKKILFGPDNQDQYIGKTMDLRSPIYCKSKKLCKTCYGDLAKFYGTPFVGILAANALGERGSQEIMKTFHCLDASTGVFLDTKNGKSLECLGSLFNKFEDKKEFTLNGTQEEIDLSDKDIKADNNGKWTKVLRIIRHKRNPNSSLIYLRTSDGHGITLQDNHPIAIQNDEGYSFIEPKDVKHKKDKLIISNNNIWQDTKRSCFIDAYILGYYLGDGCIKFGSTNKNKPEDKRPLDVLIDCPLNTKSIQHSNLMNMLNEYGYRSVSDTDKCIIIRDNDLAKKIHEETGRYSYAKHLPIDYIYYNDEDLCKILCGLIDSDGCVQSKDGYIALVVFEMSSGAIINAMCNILDKFGVKYNVCTKPGGKTKILGKDTFARMSYGLTLYPKTIHEEIFKYSVKFQGKHCSPKIMTRRVPNNIVTYIGKASLKEETDYVYDLMTEDHQFSANGILVHNTAGAVSVVIPDLIQQALDNNPNLTKDQMSKYFKQDGYQLKFNVNQEVELTLRHDEYLDSGMTEFTLDPEKSGIIKDSTIEGTNIQSALDLKPFAGHVQFADGTNLEIILDDEVFIPYEFFETREEGKNAEGIKCIVLKGNTKDIPFLFSTVIASKDLNVVMKTILGIIEKKNIMKYPEVAFNKLTKIYGDGFKVAYNHIEILISQIFRNKMKPEYPARLIEPYSAQVYGIKYISHLEGFLSGMLFENMGKSLQNGFINDTVTHNPMEQLLSDDFDFLREDKED
jgi:hypothetical protein